MTTHTIMDEIVLNDNRTLTGIIDFVSNKQIYFFDFTQETHIDYLLLAILWKGYKPELRFSVFCSIHYPEMNLPRAILLPTVNIKTTSKEVITTRRPKQRKKVIRSLKI